MARCGCGGSCGCSLANGTNTVVTGSGTAANPWHVAAVTNCAEVRNCLSGINGVNFDTATGVISADLSTTPGNGLVLDGTGLFVGAGASTVTAGCGLTGNGAPGTPLVANTSAWPYACDIATQGGVVSCDAATGRLWSEPRSHSMMGSVFFDESFANVPVPAGATQSNLIRTVTGSFTNPDPCRSAIAISMQEMEFFLTLPTNARAEYGFDADNMVQHTNRGATTETDFHVQVAKTINRGTIAPGATVSYSFGAFLGLGTNGAVYTQLNGILRMLFITQ